MMSRGIEMVTGIAAGALVLILSLASVAQQGRVSQPKRTGANQNAAHYAFRDTVDEAGNSDPSLPHFKLSAHYPTENPGKCTDCTWLTDHAVDEDFQAKFPPGKEEQDERWQKYWAKYVQLILDYVKQGQDPDLSEKSGGFRTSVNGKTRWFNVPWMAYDPTMGREFVHGTTNERTATVADLIPGSNRILPVKSNVMVMALQPGESNVNPRFRGTNSLSFRGMAKPTPAGAVALNAGANLGCDNPNGFESWSVGFYNEWGGYAVGKAFPATGQPHVVDYMGSKMPDGLPFPQGTLVVKILTTSAPVDCVSQLQGAPEWHVNRHKFEPSTGYKCEREVQVSRIVQVDVAVVDPRSPTGWVYATFAYNSDPGHNFWDSLVPIGVQWGSDPWSFPAVPKIISLPLQQTVLNPATSKLVAHYGCQDRLAGPVDNSQSSCLSCHGSSYAAPNGAPSTIPVNVPPAFGFDGMCIEYSLDNAAYFQNQQPPQHFPGGRYPDAFSLDTSLQLQVAFNQYGHFYTDHAPVKCSDPNQIGPHAPSGGQ